MVNPSAVWQIILPGIYSQRFYDSRNFIEFHLSTIRDYLISFFFFIIGLTQQGYYVRYSRKNSKNNHKQAKVKVESESL